MADFHKIYSFTQGQDSQEGYMKLLPPERKEFVVIDAEFSPRYLNADFSPIWQKTLTYEGGYEAQPTDNGSWSGGVQGSGTLVGSNMGISAPTLSKYLGRQATVADMENLTEAQSEAIAKQYYWNPINGDLINSQAIAAQSFDAVWASGGIGGMLIRRAMNQMAGSQVVPESKSMSLSTKEVGIINSFNENDFFNILTQVRADYINNLGASPTYAMYLKGWLNRLNSIYATYSDELTKGVQQITSTVTQNIRNNWRPLAVIMLLSVGVGLTIYLVSSNRGTAVAQAA